MPFQGDGCGREECRYMAVEIIGFIFMSCAKQVVNSIDSYPPPPFSPPQGLSARFSHAFASHPLPGG
jgi:hypothetical protein